jgi:hypothetical protein
MISQFLLLLFYVLQIPFIGFAQTIKNPSSPYQAKWVLVKGCSLKVAGSTNINKFVCEIADYSNPDTLLVYNPVTDKLIFPLKGALHLDVTGFNCHNPMMTSDLCKTLKSKEFPRMNIQFISLSKLPDFKSAADAITGLVNIELAGTSRLFNVNYTFYTDNRNVIHLIGKRPINFSDFKLTPPRKLGGMIRTNEELQVEFHLSMKELN